MRRFRTSPSIHLTELPDLPLVVVAVPVLALPSPLNMFAMLLKKPSLLFIFPAWANAGTLAATKTNTNIITIAFRITLPPFYQ